MLGFSSGQPWESVGPRFSLRLRASFRVQVLRDATASVLCFRWTPGASVLSVRGGGAFFGIRALEQVFGFGSLRSSGFGARQSAKYEA